MYKEIIVLIIITIVSYLLTSFVVNRSFDTYQDLFDDDEYDEAVKKRYASKKNGDNVLLFIIFFILQHENFITGRLDTFATMIIILVTVTPVIIHKGIKLQRFLSSREE